ncbi:MAG: CapA family protein, partial [Myxococcota bacterium]
MQTGWLVLSVGVGCAGAPDRDRSAVALRVTEQGAVSFVATGDVMMHRPVKRAARDAAASGSGDHDGYDALFAGIRDRVTAADLAFANLETPVAPETNRGTRSMVFDAPPVVLASLAATGFDVVSFANNHVYDQGRAGFAETLGQLEASGLGWVGAGATCDEARRARTFDLNGLSIAVLGATATFNDDLNPADPSRPCAATFDEPALVAEVERARAAGADLVVLSVHWGTEYAPLPQVDQREAAHRLIDAGVDVILGHHPHVLQPIERIAASDGRLGLVAFSLGNLVSNQAAAYDPAASGALPNDGDPRDGVLLGFRAVKRAYETDTGTVVRTEVTDVVAEPTWTSNNTAIRRRTEPVVIRVDPVSARLATARRAVDGDGPGGPGAARARAGAARDAVGGGVGAARSGAAPAAVSGGEGASERGFCCRRTWWAAERVRANAASAAAGRGGRRSGCERTRLLLPQDVVGGGSCAYALPQDEVGGSGALPRTTLPGIPRAPRPATSGTSSDASAGATMWGSWVLQRFRRTWPPAPRAGGLASARCGGGCGGGRRGRTQRPPHAHGLRITVDHVEARHFSGDSPSPPDASPRDADRGRRLPWSTIRRTPIARSTSRSRSRSRSTGCGAVCWLGGGRRDATRSSALAARPVDPQTSLGSSAPQTSVGARCNAQRSIPDPVGIRSPSGRRRPRRRAMSCGSTSRVRSRRPHRTAGHPASGRYDAGSIAAIARCAA